MVSPVNSRLPTSRSHSSRSSGVIRRAIISGLKAAAREEETL